MVSPSQRVLRDERKTTARETNCIRDLCRRRKNSIIIVQKKTTINVLVLYIVCAFQTRQNIAKLAFILSP